MAERESDLCGRESFGIGFDPGSAPSIRRSFDAGDINPILNDPEIFDLIKVPECGPLDATNLLANPLNVLLMGQGGGLLFVYQEYGIYEVHNNWLREARGRNAWGSTLEAIAWMFTHTDCMIIQTRVPAFNKAAKRLTALVGGKMDFERKAAWPTDDGPVDISYWSLRYEDWLRDKPQELLEAGRWFHKRLDEEFARHRALHASHPDEDCHDLYVGAAVKMFQGGQPEKAVILYNRWARFAGYGLMGLVARNPLMVDIGDALLQITNDGSFKVVKVSASPGEG